MEVFEFTQLFPDLRWEVMMKMNDVELVNLCRSSLEMEQFCNTKDWFWKHRLTYQFGLESSDPTLRSMLNKEKNWFRVYFTLHQLEKLKHKLSPKLDGYNLIDLYNLHDLILRFNQLTELPSEIGQLVNLKSLNLRYNQLTKLPSEIGQLVNLEFLDLNNNQLTELASEIGRLVNLQYLDLSYNQLTGLPSEIGRLVN